MLINREMKRMSILNGQNGIDFQDLNIKGWRCKMIMMKDKRCLIGKTMTDDQIVHFIKI